MSTRSEHLDAVLRYFEAYERVVCDRVEPHPLGHSLLTPSLPKIWALNALAVARPAGEDLDAAALARESERLLAAAGVPHGRVDMSDDVVGAVLAPDFRVLGWRAERIVVMVHDGREPPAFEPALVAEPEEDVLGALNERIHRSQEYGSDDEAVAQFVELDRRTRRRLDSHTFTAPAAAPVAKVDLNRIDGVAEIDSVETLADARGRGLARSVVAAALAEARGAELVFLLAADDDWPKEWYARLGFEVVGAVWEFNGPAA